MESEANTGRDGQQLCDTRGLTGQTLVSTPSVAAWCRAAARRRAMADAARRSRRADARSCGLSRSLADLHRSRWARSGLPILCGAFALFGAALLAGPWRIVSRNRSRPRAFAPGSRRRRKNACRTHKPKKKPQNRVRRRRVFSAQRGYRRKTGLLPKRTGTRTAPRPRPYPTTTTRLLLRPASSTASMPN